MKTWLATTPEEDVDARMSNDVLATVRPDYFKSAILGATNPAFEEYAAAYNPEDEALLESE